MNRIATAVSWLAITLACAGSPAGTVSTYKMPDTPSIEAEKSSSAQEMSAWCWAACVQMVYESQGAKVTQTEIVSKVKGVPVNDAGHFRDVAGLLNGLGVDDNGAPVASTCVTLLADGSGRFRQGNTSVSAETIAYLLLRGLPSILLYRHDEQNNHYVIVTGLEIDSSHPERPTRLMVRDPWPLDENMHRIRSDGRAVDKTLDGTYWSKKGLVLLVPFVFTGANEERMKSLAAAVAQGVRKSDLDALAEDDHHTADLPGDAAPEQSAVLPEDLGDYVKYDRTSVVKWANGNTRVTFEIRYKNISKVPIRLTARAEGGSLPARMPIPWEDFDVADTKEATKELKPGQEMTLSGTFDLVKPPGGACALRYYSGSKQADLVEAVRLGAE